MSRTATPRDLIPEPHAVLGTLLRAFSLGHHLLLTKLGSPYAGRAEAADLAGLSEPSELALAVFICAADPAETLAAQLRADWEPEFRRWSKKLRGRPWERTPFDHRTELAKFLEYLADGYRRPPVWRHDATGKLRLSAPWECLLEARLVSGGYHQDEVRSMYLPAAWYAYQTLAELRQADTLEDPAKWKKVFYTAEDDARLVAVSLEPGVSSLESTAIGESTRPETPDPRLKTKD